MGLTPDALHEILAIVGWVALSTLVVATLLIHLRLRSRWSLLLLIGLALSATGRGLQVFSPVDELAYDEFRGIVVSSGELPLSWYAGSLLSALGWLVSAAAALGLALGLRREGWGAGGKLRRREGPARRIQR